MDISIRGLQEAQRSNMRDMAAVKTTGGLGRAIQMVALDAHRFEVSITHVDTGALRASQRVGMDKPARWTIYIDPSATNPRTGQNVNRYAEPENSRGGEHAFAERTLDQADQFVGRARTYLLSQID